MLDYAVAFTNFSGAFPDILAVNASGPSATDGTEFVSNMINDSMWGVNQMILNHAGLSPNGVLESDSASQIKEALQKGFGAPPGTSMMWDLDDDPGVSGHRCLFKNGQGIIRANFADLDDVAYVGDANNAAVAAGGGAYFRADNSDGSSPNIAGVYLILPETRGYTPRGIDAAATVDPDGASRFLGDNQLDAMQKITGTAVPAVNTGYFNAATGVGSGVFVAGAATTNILSGILVAGNALTFDSAQSVSPNASKTDDVETRMSNFATKFVVWY